MATTKALRSAKDAPQGEYSLHDDGSTGQEWILDGYRALEPGNYLREFTSQRVRPDGRPFSAARPVAVLPSIFARNSYGSAMVTLGASSENNAGCTRVVAACTLLVGHPSPATPAEGDVDVTFTASPLSGPRFDMAGRENGEVTSGNFGVDVDANKQPLPPSLAGVVTNVKDHDGTNANPSPTDTKEIESWIRRTIRSSRFINPHELGIEPGKSAWRVRISIHLLNHEGNVWDAALLGACAALADLRLPMVEIDGGAVRIVKDEGVEAAIAKGGKGGRRRKGRSLSLGPLPVPLTTAILPRDEQGSGSGSVVLLVDPTHLEEDVASGNSVTVVCNAKEEIVEFHKKGGGSRLSVGQMQAVAAMGFGRARELEGLVLGR